MSSASATGRMFCPACGSELEATRSRDAVVWLCHACRAGAATVPILRRLAPRALVNRLWQGAREAGEPSPYACPSCTQPFTRFRAGRNAADPLLDVCMRCHWVWFQADLLLVAARAADPPLVPPGSAG